jgi:hypothetical protein
VVGYVAVIVIVVIVEPFASWRPMYGCPPRFE